MNCQICGAELPEGAMFCGECGSSTTATAATRKRQDQRPEDTTIIQPLRRTPTVISVPIGGGGADGAGGGADGTGGTGGTPGSGGAFAFGAAFDAGAEPEHPSISRLVSESLSARAVAGHEPGVAPGGLAQESGSWPVAAQEHEQVAGATDRPEERRIPRPTVRFVLQFSTGETVVVHGSGLIGRRPLPQPSERYDHLIQIADVGMSVSKTHLEFGQHDGEFWISDRFSGNGTAIRRPDEAAQRCEPGRRYLVPRGSRVELADQFFMVI